MKEHSFLSYKQQCAATNMIDVYCGESTDNVWNLPSLPKTQKVSQFQLQFVLQLNEMWR